MPRLSRWFLRLALVHWLIGVSIGGAMLANKGLHLAPQVYSLVTLHWHSLLFGWTMQFAFGVAFWIAPRLSAQRPAGDPRGIVWLAWLALGLLNVGVVLAGWGSALSIWLRYEGWNMAIALGGLAEAASALAMAVHLWPRIRPVIIPEAVSPQR